MAYTIGQRVLLSKIFQDWRASSEGLITRITLEDLNLFQTQSHKSQAAWLQMKTIFKTFAASEMSVFVLAE
jgi:hypothetical protein